jgi:hypothetical protein
MTCYIGYQNYIFSISFIKLITSFIRKENSEFFVGGKILTLKEMASSFLPVIYIVALFAYHMYLYAADRKEESCRAVSAQICRGLRAGTKKSTKIRLEQSSSLVDSCVSSHNEWTEYSICK